MTAAATFQRATGAAGGVIAAHLLGPAGRGVYALVVLAGAGGALLATCGLQFWVARRLAVDPGDGAVRGVLLRHARLLLPWLALVAAAGTAVVPAGTRGALLAAAALVAANAASLLLLAVPTGQRRTGVTAAALASGGVAWLAWLGMAVVAGWHSPAVVALGATVSHLAIAGACARWAGPLRASAPSAVQSEHAAAVRGHLAPGLGELVLLSAFRVDVALVAVLASPTAAGIYAVATSLAELIWLVPDAVATVLLPHLAGSADAGTGPALRLSLAAMGMVSLPLLVAPDWIISMVFGEPYRGAASALPWLVGAALLLGIWKVETTGLVARGRGGVRLWSAVSALGVLIAGDLVLVPAHGPTGAAWACAAGYAAATAFALRAARRRRAAPADPVLVGVVA
jgi:O-antigen/teichoic acid export membrane protein